MIREKIFTLDILRILAAFCVFIFHLHLHCTFNLNLKILNDFFSNGAVVMVLFFMLSGFLLFYTNYENDFSEFSNIFKFLLKRIIRIYPIYLVYLISVYFLDKTTILNKIVLIPCELFLQQSLYPSSYDYVGNSGSWFVSTIFILYILFPYIMQILKNIKIKQIFVILIMIFFAIYPAIIPAYFEENMAYIYANPAFRIPEFVIGMCIAKIYIENTKMKSNILLSLFLSFTLVLIISILSHNNFLNHMRFDSRYIFFNIITVPLFALIIYSTACLKDKYAIAFCKSFIVQYAAKISFAFFLVQCWTFYIYFNVLKNKIHMSNSKLFIILFTLNLLFSIITYEIVEKRLTKIIKNKIYNSLLKGHIIK